MATNSSAPKYDFKKLLEWTNGDKYNLQVSTKAFYNMLDENQKRREYIKSEQLNSKQLLNISKRAFEREELNVAETFIGKAIQKQKVEDASSKSNPELYYHLAEILQQKATEGNLQQLERQKLLLHATVLYNFVKNCLIKIAEESEFTTNISKRIPEKVLDAQQSLIKTAGGNSFRCKFNWDSKKKALKELREETKSSLEDINAKYDAETGSDEDLRKMFIKQTPEVKDLFKKVATRVKQLVIEIIEECLDVLGKPPCNYEVILLGSLAREEMTPYSDIEWAILTSSEDEECKTFFRSLTNLVHFQIINLGETILPVNDIEVLRGDWFYDDVTPRGLSFDAFLPQACKTPWGNSLDFELIHTPATMANFQSEYWYKKHPHLGDILLTVAPLQDDQQTLLGEYKAIIGKILREPHDIVGCTKNNTVLSSRGRCILSKDVDRYGKTMLDSHQAFDGKEYDVKKEIYRLNDRVIVGFSMVFGITTNGSFKIVDDLCERKVICSSAKDNLASALAISLKFKLYNDLLAEKQDEAGKTRSNNSNNKTGPVNNRLFAYDTTRKEELFHFFYVSTPLYEMLQEFCDDRIDSNDFERNLFFDCSDRVKGHIHCRMLNYVAALDCYKCALKFDPGNINLVIKHMRIDFILGIGSDDVSLIEEKFKALLQEIHKKAAEGKDSKRKRDFLDQLVDMHLLHASYCVSQGDMKNAIASLEECNNIESDISELQKLNVRVKLINTSQIRITQEEFDEIIYQLTALIKDEGNSVMGIIWLNELGQFLMHQDKIGEACQCLKRALLMGRIIFGDSINFHVLWTLFMLGRVCFCLFMYEEAKFYFSLILKPFVSSEEQIIFVIEKQVSHQLAMINTFTDNHVEAITFFENSLDISNKKKIEMNQGRTKVELMIDCLTHCGLATIWFKLGEKEKAWQSALNANDCLDNIIRPQHEVSLVCIVSKTLMDLGMSDEAMLLLMQGLAREQDAVLKEKYLSSLGKLCFQKGFMEDAKCHYTKSLEILKSELGNTPKIVERLLNITELLIDNKNPSEAFTYMSDTLKYVSALVDNSDKCNYLIKMVDNWEKIGDYDEALHCLEQAVKVCQSSNKNAREVAIVEFDLHIKFSDLVEKNFTRSLSKGERSFDKQIINAQRLHYDRAGNVLRQQLAVGQFNSQTISLFLLLASKYHSIDFVEKEKLLLKALQMSEVIYGSENTNEQVASILIELADIYILKKDYENAVNFFERSLQIEMKLHCLDPYHSNIIQQISLLKVFLFVYPEWKNLKTTLQQVLIFLKKHSREEALMNSVRKAICFSDMALLCCFSDDLKKAETLNKIARDIFTTIKQNEFPQDIILEAKKICGLNDVLIGHLTNASDEVFITLHKSIHILGEMFSSLPETVYFSNKETVQTSGVYKYTLYNQAVLLDRNVSGKYFQGDASMEMSLHSKIIKLNSNLKNVSVNAEAITEKEHLATFQIASREKLQEYDSPNHLPKHMHNKDCEFLTVSIKSHANQLNITDKNDIAYTVDKNNPKNTNVNQSLYIKDKSGVDKSLKESKADVENIISVTDSILHNYMKGDLETAYQLIENSRELLFTSFSFDDQIQFLLNRAENAKTNKDISALIGSVDLASKSFNTGNSKPEAKFFKLNGECQLYMKNYRTAEISFNQAVGFHRSATTGLGFHHYFEYAETLIGLVKSRLVFNKLEEALCTCEEGIAIISSIETQLMTSRLLVQLFYLAAKCKFQISKNLTLEDNLKQVMIFCQHALETSEFVDRLTGTNDLTEELAIGNGEFFALKCEIRLLMASTLLRQKKLEEAQKIAKDLNEFLQNLFVVFEMFSKDTWPSGKNDFITIQCSLFSLNGRALVISNETEDALINLKKSLAIVFTLPSVQAVVTVEEIITLIDAITVIAAKTSIKKSCSPLQEALKICKNIFLEENENLEKLWKFFDSLGNIYVNKNRNVEAIIVYEAGLLLADCLEDASESRGQTLLNLANAHRLRAINDDVQPNVSEKHGLAEKYYQTPNGFGTENSSVFKHIMYAYFLYDECRFREAEMILKQTVEDDKLWSREVFCEYSQRILFGSDIQFYVESFGELHTNMGNLAYSLLVRVYVQLGNKREAVISFDKLSTEGRDLQPRLGISTVCLSYLLEKSEKYLVSLIEEPGKLSFDESDFPLSTENLAKVYYELGEYEFTLNMCVTARKFTFLSTECQLSIARLEGNASVMFAESDTRHPYKTFLHLLQQQEKIFNKSFDDQHAILSQYSFPKPYFIYSSLARMLDDKKIDNKIACYEHCLRMNRGYDIDQNMVGTLTELYQAKAFTEGKNDKIVYQSWMEKAQTCFQKFLERKIKMTPFVEIVYASFLKRIKRFDEAIFLLEQIISKDKDDWSITFSEVDVPLFGVYVAQEIKARVKLSLPKQIFVYYQTVLVYLESGNLENAKECALRMETYVNSLTYDTIVHSFLGYTFKEIGKKQKAQEILQLVLNKEPDNEPVKLALVEF